MALHSAQAGPAILKGHVEAVGFRSPDNKFCMATVVTDHESFHAQIRGTAVWAGQGITLTGAWSANKHGRFFASTSVSTTNPHTEEGLKRFLCSEAFPGIGKKTASRLVQMFKLELISVITSTPELISDLPGLTKRTTAILTKGLADISKNNQDDKIFFHDLGLTAHQVKRMQDILGDRLADALRANPFLLARHIPRFGFKRCDAIALRWGRAPDDPLRIQGGIQEVFQVAQKSRGHTVLPAEEVIHQTTSLLSLDADLIARQLEQPSDQVTRTAIGPVTAYAETKLHRAEQYIAERFASMAQGLPPWRRVDPGQALDLAHRATGKTLDDSQCAALLGLLSSKISILDGGPGTGKTTILKALVHVVRQAGATLRQAALSGIAAVNMSKATGFPSSTIHSMLGSNPEHGGFLQHETNMLDVDLVVLDEMSMTDVQLLAAVLKAMPPHAALVMVGDGDQLEPVGPGRPFVDAGKTGRIARHRLTEIHRQARGSHIITGAHAINHGMVPDFGDPKTSDFIFLKTASNSDIKSRILDLSSNRIPAKFGLHPIRDIQIISPMKVRELGTHELTPGLRAALNPPPTDEPDGLPYRLGDKVIHVVNNKDLGVRNGEIGIVTTVEPPTKNSELVVTVTYPDKEVSYDTATLKELKFGYAITIHKMQGSEAPAVIIPITSTHSFMWRRRLLYTAVTRARKLAILVGQEKTLIDTINNFSDVPRYTQLAAFLNDI